MFLLPLFVLRCPMSEIKRRRREPSYRNLQIYHEVAYRRRTQTAVAPQIGVSQRRISGICTQVRAWVDRILPGKILFGNEGRRFHLAIAHERMRLQQALDPVTAVITD